MAKGGVWGPLEGKASSLVHPVLMVIFLVATNYAGFLGWQWRELRVVGVDLAQKRKELPREAEGAEPSPAAQELKKEIEELTAKRKELQEGNFKDRHYQLSALLLGSNIFITAYGTFNTWFRADRLFPGDHLYQGAAITVLWGLAAACVPWMEKGNDTARNLHIVLNAILITLFFRQFSSGLEITNKVLDLDIPWF